MDPLNILQHRDLINDLQIHQMDMFVYISLLYYDHTKYQDKFKHTFSSFNLNRVHRYNYKHIFELNYQHNNLEYLGMFQHMFELNYQNMSLVKMDID